MKNESSFILVKNDSASSLTRLYIYALSAIALLSIFGHILVQKSIHDESNDSYIINMAGRQRMLSQRICKDILILESDSHTNKTKYLNQLNDSFVIWQKFQNGLRLGDTSLILKGHNSKMIMDLFQQQDPYFKEMAKNVRDILSLYTTGADRSSISIPVRKVLDAEVQYLNLMMAIVNQYDQEARQKDDFVKRTEIVLLISTLLVLLLEALLVFRPAVFRIRNSFEALVQSENMTKEANQKLSLTQRELKNANENLELRIQETTNQLSVKNKELEDKNEQLARMNKDLDNFVYTASHDLKGPINNIEGLVDALSPELCKEAGLPEMHLSLIKESVVKFNSVLKELSDIGKARVEASGRSISVSFKEVLNEIELSMKGVIEASGAIISDDFSSVPHINYSQKNLRSILYNLLSNAIKYHSPERKPFIRILTKLKENYIVLKVNDNGIGISEEDIPKMFSMFTRFTDQVEGTGVGLATIKKIVENSGGKIEVQSKFGQGTTFCVYFWLTKIE